MEMWFQRGVLTRHGRYLRVVMKALDRRKEAAAGDDAGIGMRATPLDTEAETARCGSGHLRSASGHVRSARSARSGPRARGHVRRRTRR